MSETLRELVPLYGEAVAHCTSPFSPLPVADQGSGLELPYLALRGPGFERLCFQLLLKDGFVPQFFGVSGQAQYGVDLVADDHDGTTVYQCKNNKTSPSEAYLRDEVLGKFEAEWLGKASLIGRIL